MLKFFNYQNTATFTKHKAFARGIKWTASKVRIFNSTRHREKQGLPRKTNRVDTAVATTHQKEIAMVTAHDAQRFTNCQKAGYIVLSDGIVWALSIVQNRNLTR